MSWDLFVQDWGNARTLEEIPDDFQPQSIGTRSNIIDQIMKIEPTVKFYDKSIGNLENDQFSIEFNMGNEEQLNSFSMHVRGSELSIPCIGNILKQLNLRATDGTSPDFFDTASAIDSLQNWIQFRNNILAK
ncbi:hypothetical protein [Pontibacter sp. G13]|uniref:hypothetical protein n=1 Tax=Pontibacter sp. G13 TaxID=3074898 RepID=UPI00288B107C|nr:hypothetical protein [Pontibacter sp. G13]WNJ18254.1 hypothetical protein RJD25_25665 [Pontibacter sp. G13]